MVSVKEDFRGEVPVGFVCLKVDCDEADSKKISNELIQLVRNDIGPVAVFKSAVIIPKLPKTRFLFKKYKLNTTL